MNLAKSGANGCRWIYIGADGCCGVRGHEGSEKQEKKEVKRSSRACFATSVNGQNKQTNIRVTHGDQRGVWGGLECKQGMRGGTSTSMIYNKATKQTAVPKKPREQAIYLGMHQDYNGNELTA